MAAILRYALVVSTLYWLGACASQPAQPPLPTIAALDVPRYLGTWHEIAKYPNWFQAKCVADTSADYSLRDDGTVRVVNRCRRANGDVDEAVGTARQLGGATSPRLEVRFAPAWLSWLPSVWGDYWVIDLDPQYQLAAIGEPSRRYLWILARTPTVEAASYRALLSRLRQLGYDVNRLEVSAAQAALIAAAQ
jgi:apolipoprotein D and lipocalin family protein